nr:nuclear receptor coactivator 7 isoform X2 [Bactrocera oleae]XP_036229208.1 nuclear receptor coactivator 7 isoform X2 [Bactrocera oleae]XP_036229209.1 nuclear receptor coactivator 7 isoform X2 [Bactrocera oleae]XP_036229210.1 nuclear receptor coactivator 7 isoform X2 [Bactrocera oleae]XP_036229211.1 nuclear receptor coactivator 7 isoform X2 [Bactrocera oleae]XP_036229212.1 nuclear receptor coactivator 7 isoform X2 [Bactrocera oleae]XP_036229213.1 nuclear receptor coactivator 7 isoform X2 [B
MSIIDSGRYRLRKDWASASIPSLVDIDEHVSDEVENSLNITTPLPPPKPPRRSSLALGLFSSKGDKSQKRRSSIAVFLRRDSNKNSTKDSYESAVKHEKSDGSNTPASPEISFSSAENVRASSPNEPGKVTYFDDGSSLRPIVKGINNIYDSPVDKERNRRRRSSLQAKLERHRRKNNDISQLSIDNSLPSGSQSDLTNGSMGGSAIGASSGDLTYGDIDPNHSAYFPRQKRHSWWNIFVPDNLKTRSRRASQDVSLMSRSVDNLAVPVRRSKSRSVDHGLAAPFDLDSLRSKVEGRFESVDRLTNERKKSSLPTIPTKSYTVGNRDTLTSVAARFDTTPSELTHLNRLNSSFIYPGQQLLVPDKSAAKNDSVSGSATGIDEKGSNASISGKSSPIDRKLSTTDEQNDENDILEGLRPGSPKPGHIERVDSAKSTDNAQAEANKSDDPVITQRFLKINVRHITDGQGVVGGVLLVTPNAVMFDPNVSDPLVIEHGPESYGVIAPMELVVNAAIFHDIAHMRVSGGINTEQNENAEIYYPQAVLEAKQAKEAKERGDEGDGGARKQSATGGSMETCDDQESLCSNTGEREQKDAEKCVEAKEESAKTDNEVNTKANKTEDDADANDLKKTLNLTDSRTTLEERRKSLLDHHWAIPSKDRLYYLNSRRSSEDEGDNESQTTIDSGARGQDPHSATSSISGIGAASGALHLPGGLALADLEHLEELAKQSCYDSGIDIREPIANLQPIPKKTVYSDADIVLSSDWVPPKTISPTLMSESPPRSSVLSAQNLDAGTVGGRKKTTSVSFSVDDNNSEQQAVAAVTAASAQGDKNAEKKNKMLKRLSYPLAWVEGLTGEAGGPPGTGGSLGKSADSESAPNTGDSNQSVFSKVFSRRSSIGTFMRPQSSEGTASTTKLKDVKQQPKLDYRSMVSVDDKPELFISVDKLIPRPARACPDPPLYLRLRMGKPIGKAIPLPTSVMSYGKNKLRPEYWFSVPKNRVDELYRFINTWVQHLYGELNEEQIKARGFELIQDDTEWTKSGTSKSGRSGSQENEEISDLTRESWEVLSMSTDDYRKASLFATGSFDLDFPIPDLIGTTEILTEEHREKLCGHLPARAEGYSWSLIFSTSQHGFSLNSLYRKMQKLESPILIVIQDTENNVFGALTSCSLHVSDHFYGTGESLLYKFNPSFKVFHWTGENLYFIKGNMESLSIGAGDGRFGLWLDGDLNQGRSQSCSTYGNEPLAPQEDFVIKTLECWAFV